MIGTVRVADCACASSDNDKRQRAPDAVEVTTNGEEEGQQPSDSEDQTLTTRAHGKRPVRGKRAASARSTPAPKRAPPPRKAPSNRWAAIDSHAYLERKIDAVDGKVKIIDKRSADNQESVDLLRALERAFHKLLDEFKLLQGQVNELQREIDIFKGSVVPADGAGPSALVPAPAQADDETEVEAEQSGSESGQGRVVVAQMGRRRHSFLI
jgi:hypothetical protein